MKTEEFKLLMKARKNVYDLLRCFFLQEPNEDFLAALKDENILNDLVGYNDDLDKGVELISTALAETDLTLLAASLTEDFTRLFTGPLAIPLYESDYRSESGSVRHEVSLSVRRRYLESRLFIHPDHSSSEDHIGAEIEFIYYLCQKAAESDRPDSQKDYFLKQQEFLRDHLVVWVPPFCDRLFCAAKTPYFQGVAKITRGFLFWDFEELMASMEE